MSFSGNERVGKLGVMKGDMKVNPKLNFKNGSCELRENTGCFLSASCTMEGSGVLLEEMEHARHYSESELGPSLYWKEDHQPKS